jgi:NAD-dependent DNA ligase
LHEANLAYYGQDHAPGLSDNEYDILHGYLQQLNPFHPVLTEGHTVCKDKKKVPLPYPMWSMDKIKPDTAALQKWTAKYAGPYILSCKLDGVSGLYSTEGPEPRLYTRGNGLLGQDVSHLIPFLHLPVAAKGVTVRGEFILKKAVFSAKYANEFANPRNLVAGMINQKNGEPAKYQDLSFVIYEVLHPPNLNPAAQLAFLEKRSFPEIVQYKLSPAPLTNEILSALLLKWRLEYAYEIDGLVCSQDAVFPRAKGNPEYAFAFKMIISEQVAEAKVVDVIWTPSKDGYLKPRVQIEPIILSGVQIEYATGFNARFIVEHQIGIGALVRIVRSGEVIPHILAVVKPAVKPCLPSPSSGAYQWNDTEVDFVLLDKAGDLTVLEKNLAGFFQSLEVDGLSSGTVRRLIAARYTTLSQIVEMTIPDFLQIAGFKETLATKLVTGIKNRLQTASLPDLMHASNIFGRGFGLKKFQSILAVFQPQEVAYADAVSASQIAAAVPGLALKTAQQFLAQLPAFKQLMHEIHLDYKWTVGAPASASASPSKIKKYVFTGFRSKELANQLAGYGFEESATVTKNTIVLIAKDLREEDSQNRKMQDAKKWGIPIMTPAEVLLAHGTGTPHGDTPLTPPAQDN